MGIQISIPFAVLQNGAVSVETSAAVQVQQRVDAIISTEVGQRAMRAQMGLPLSRLLFDPNNTLVTGELTQLVTQQLNLYEPGLKVVSVDPVLGSANDGTAAINVNYSPQLQASTAASANNVVTVEVGGTVKEINLNGHS